MKGGPLKLSTPLNFVSTATSSAATGSPVINRQGELVGLIFDGNIQSLPGYFVYDAGSQPDRGRGRARNSRGPQQWSTRLIIGGERTHRNGRRQDRGKMTPARLPRSVRLLGWVSLLTDAATEAVYPLLPVFITQVLGGPPIALGIVEGAADATSSLLKILSGKWSDRLAQPQADRGGRLRVVVDRSPVHRACHIVGTCLRDSRHRPGGEGHPRCAARRHAGRSRAPGQRGRVFGYHWGMDHAGAAVGPLLATVFLWFAPENYRLLFGLTIIPGTWPSSPCSGCPKWLHYQHPLAPFSPVLGTFGTPGTFTARPEALPVDHVDLHARQLVRHVPAAAALEGWSALDGIDDAVGRQQ